MSYILRIWGTSILEKGICSKESENCIEEKAYPKVRDRSEHVAPFLFYSFSGTLEEAPQALKLLICHLRKLRKH